MYEELLLATDSNGTSSFGFVSWLVPTISSMIGVLVGAALTYWYQLRLIRIQQQKENHHAAIENQFTLFCQLNHVVFLSRYLDQFKEDPLRHVKLNRLTHTINRPRIRPNALVFLLSTKHADIVAKLEVCEQKYQRMLDAIQERIDLLDGRAMDYVSSEIDAGREPNENDWRILRLKTFTDQVYDAAQDYLEYNSDCVREFRDALKSEYPDKKFLNIKVLEESE